MTGKAPKLSAFGQMVEEAFGERDVLVGQPKQRRDLIAEIEAQGMTEDALIAKYETLSDTRQDAMRWSVKARDALAVLPQHELRTMLEDLAEYVVARIS